MYETVPGSGYGHGVSDRLTELAVSASGGDRAALSDLIRASQAQVWRFVAHMGGTSAADDLTQETYLRAVVALPGFEARSSALTWLLSIARRVVVDQIRHDRSRPELIGVDTAHLEASAGAQTHENRVELLQLLARLDEDRRTAFVLTQVMGFSYAEAAEICSCAVGTIRSRIARARAELIPAIGE